MNIRRQNQRTLPHWIRTAAIRKAWSKDLLRKFGVWGRRGDKEEERRGEEYKEKG